MYSYLYVEVNIICIITLAIILWKELVGGNERIDNAAFDMVLVSTIALLGFDVLWALDNGGTVTLPNWARMAVNSCYLFLTGVVSYLWFRYTELKLSQNKKPGRLKSVIMALPLVVLFALCVLAPVNKLLFYVDADGVYHRGTLHFVQIIVTYVYMFGAFAHSMICYFRETDVDRRAEFATLAKFVVIPAVGGAIQLVVFGLPSTGPCITLSLLMVYIDFQNHQISTDGLTGLNNRRQLDRFLRGMTGDQRARKRVFLLLMDVDEFKSINDTLGHYEGDMALVNTARCLKSACRSHRAFLARYGGDEFAVLFEAECEADARQLENDIIAELERFNATGGARYKLKLSIGSAELSQGSDHPAEELIRKADEELYKHKAAKGKRGRGRNREG